jgi:hypothetical protein
MRHVRGTDRGSETSVLGRPGLADVSPAEVVRATGLSSGYVRRVKAGQVTPHPMWWELMRQISGT